MLHVRMRTPDKGQSACGNNDLMKHVERLKKIITIAYKNNWVSNDPLKNIDRLIEVVWKVTNYGELKT